jgi:hypothetical protein
MLRDRLLLAAALALLALPCAARADGAPRRVRHLPPAEIRLGDPLRVEAEVDQGWKLDALELHFRPAGGAWTTVAFGKTSATGWAAVVEGVAPPSVEYFIRSQEAGRAADEFASAAAPHPVLVVPTEDDVVRQERLLRHQGHRSRTRVVGEWVDYGSHGRAPDGTRYDDRYYRMEAEYLYRTLTTISYVRLGMVRLRGTVPPPQAFDATAFTPGGASTARRDTGVDYGYAELSLALSELVGVQGRLILAADDVGFGTGIGGSLRVGEVTAAHLEVGAQTITRAGFDAFARFAWDTVPRWPMSLTLHVTNEPAAKLVPGTASSATDGGAPTGVRAVWEVGYELTAHVTAAVRGGYQARLSTAGGPTLGAGLTVEW